MPVEAVLRLQYRVQNRGLGDFRVLDVDETSLDIFETEGRNASFVVVRPFKLSLRFWHLFARILLYATDCAKETHDLGQVHLGNHRAATTHPRQ